MKKILAICCFLTGVVHAQSTMNPKVSAELRAAFTTGAQQDVLVVVKGRANITPAAQMMTKTAKTQFVFQALRAHAEQSQRDIRAFLQQKQAKANSFYVVNAISVKNCSAELANELAQFDAVEAIAADPNVAFIQPVQSFDTPAERSATEWGINKINAPSVWDLGYTGQGVVVGGADTGYDWEHPAIRPHYNGLNAQTGAVDHNYNWHDAIKEQNPLNSDPNNPCGFDIDQPCDDQSHGTHTMGTMTGDDGLGNQIGVAPGATWVGCRNMERGWGQPSTYIECFEWFLAPTDVNGENPKPERAPDVINNSWYCAVSEGCTDLAVNELMRQAVINLKAAGVVVIVSNGNFGGQGCNSTYGPPAYFAESFSIGSTQESDTISNFSSRGPVTIDGSNRVKPDVSAPGQFVRSCTPNNGYAYFSGTSMAGPHAVGMVALILSANPALKGQVAVVEDIIKNTCVKLDGLADCSDNNGLDYPNNTYGYGRIDALAAVQMAIATSDFPICTQLPGLFVFPNPTADVIRFNPMGLKGRLHVIVYNNHQQIMREEQIAENQILTIPAQQWPAGVYTWEAKLDDGQVFKGRFVKI